jgi:L-histidine N-alpha-methyltransferase
MYDVAERTGSVETAQAGKVVFHDHHPGETSFRDALHAGLSQAAKAIPCRFLYDARGSALFDRICDLPEYYPTRTETGILRDNAAEIAALIGPDAQLVELGSGSSTKVRILLDAADNPSAYVPIDISREHLLTAARAIQADYPELRVEAVSADYDQDFDLPPVRSRGRRVGFYPGSTIGNLEPEDAQAFLAKWAKRLGPGAALLVGVDRELGTDFDPTHFRHRAVYHPATGQMRIDLVSTASQTVTLDDRRYAFGVGEAVHVENSNKYTLAGFRTLARSAGFEPTAVWTDADDLFSVHMLDVVR